MEGEGGHGGAERLGQVVGLKPEGGGLHPPGRIAGVLGGNGVARIGQRRQETSDVLLGAGDGVDLGGGVEDDAMSAAPAFGRGWRKAGLPPEAPEVPAFEVASAMTNASRTDAGRGLEGPLARSMRSNPGSANVDTHLPDLGHGDRGARGRAAWRRRKKVGGMGVTGVWDEEERVAPRRIRALSRPSGLIDVDDSLVGPDLRVWAYETRH